MTIDPIPHAAANRTENNNVAFAQLSPLDGGEGSALESAQSSFSSVLSSLVEVAADAPDPADLAPTGLLAQPADPGPEADPSLDPATLLAQFLGGANPTLVPAVAATVEGLPEGRSVIASERSGVMPDDLPQQQASAEPGSPRGLNGSGTVDLQSANGGPVSDPDLGSGEQVPSRARRQGAMGLQHAQTSGNQTDSQALRGDDGPQGSGNSASARGDWRSATATQVERAAFTPISWADSAGAGFRSLPALRSAERVGGRSVFLSLDAVAPGTAAASNYAAQAASGAASMATLEGPMAPGASSEVAQKVHYWVTRGVQNAEIQLDAFGGSAVDVSITLQGKEALVEFRSDQPEARRVLQEAMPQLRDLLRSEGLQLAGGFVGTSAQQQQSQGDARRDTADAAFGRVGSAQVTGPATERTGRVGAGSAHALDVFV